MAKTKKVSITVSDHMDDKRWKKYQFGYPLFIEKEKMELILGKEDSYNILGEYKIDDWKDKIVIRFARKSSMRDFASFYEIGKDYD